MSTVIIALLLIVIIGELRTIILNIESIDIEEDDNGTS